MDGNETGPAQCHAVTVYDHDCIRRDAREEGTVPRLPHPLRDTRDARMNTRELPDVGDRSWLSGSPRGWRYRWKEGGLENREVLRLQQKPARFGKRSLLPARPGEEIAAVNEARAPSCALHRRTDSGQHRAASMSGGERSSK